MADIKKGKLGKFVKKTHAPQSVDVPTNLSGTYDSDDKKVDRLVNKAGKLEQERRTEELPVNTQELDN